uniref:CSC1/OSCA1-like 7TM region domain-containing protein n=1 Tax=Globisporangium ultimum (strain ATCC 200006 / CBS 805.95 / DAOM BR144) TaxID=431595 RepID=K3XBV7_GLOUD
MASTSEALASPVPSVTEKRIDIWGVDYNATVAREAAMGWQGLGYVLGLNAAMFLVAFVIFQLYARSTRFSLFKFRTFTFLSAHKDTPFTLKDWVDLLWRTPIRDTEVEEQLGPEGTFYLLYELYMSKMLAALSIYAFIVLLPLYLSIGMDKTALEGDGGAVALTNATALLSAPSPLPTFLRAPAASLPPRLDLAAAATSLPVPGAEDKWWSFTHSTIRSIPDQSPYLWIPVITCYIFTGAFMVLLRKLSQLSSIPSSSSSRPAQPNEAEEICDGEHGSELQNKPASNKKADRTHLIGMQPSELSLRSLFINRGLPKTLREERFLYLMHEVFPGYVDDVSVVLNMAEFHRYQRSRRGEEDKLQRAKILHEKKEKKEPISWSLWLFPGSMKFPYLHRIFQCNPKPFEDEERDIQTKIKLLREAEEECLQRILRENNGAGRAFIIFKNSRLRARFVRRVRNQSITSILTRFPEDALPKLKRYVRELGITRWHMSTAPEPDDIDWNSVSFPFVKRTIVVVLVNLAILVMLFVFTSPIAVTSAIANSNSYTNAASSVSDFVAQIHDLVEKYSPQMAKMMVSYIPTLILVVINAVLLNVLQNAGRIQPIATDSAKERMILRTASVYLIFNTIFVPSLAFVSIDAVLLYINRDGEVLDVLGTLFLHNSGIFYVYYVLQRCFLGTAVSLLRVSEYAKFSWEKPRAVTPREHVESVEAWPFFTGTQMAIQISMITIVLTFSTVVPLILPIGMLYFAMQHAIDKYLLLRVRPRIKGRGSIARTATHATIVSLLIYLGAMSGFCIVRGTKMQSTCVMVLLMITYILCLWWYIRDKERAFIQTTKGHYQELTNRQCNHAHHQPKKNAADATPKPDIASLADAVAIAVKAEAAEEVGSTGEPEPPQQQDPVVQGDGDAPASPHFQLKPQKAALLNETSALLMLAAKREVATASSPEEESDLYREPALRKRKKKSITNLDSRDYGGVYGSLLRSQTEQTKLSPQPTIPE